MYHKVKSYIEEHHMINHGDVDLAGVSGGGDSMAMLDMLESTARKFLFPCARYTYIMESAGRRQTGMKLLCRTPAAAGEFLFCPIIIQFWSFQRNGRWEPKRQGEK